VVPVRFDTASGLRPRHPPTFLERRGAGKHHPSPVSRDESTTRPVSPCGPPDAPTRVGEVETHAGLGLHSFLNPHNTPPFLHCRRRQNPLLVCVESRSHLLRRALEGIRKPTSSGPPTREIHGEFAPCLVVSGLTRRCCVFQEESPVDVRGGGFVPIGGAGTPSWQ